MNIKSKFYNYINIFFRIFWCLLLLISSEVFTQCIQPGDDVWNESWESCQKTTNPNPARISSHWVLFEFPTQESITESHLWNANRAGESIKGANSITIDYSIDGINWIHWGNFNLPKAPESANYTGVPGPNFGSLFMKKILFTINSTHGDPTCTSIAEVKFTIDDTACYGNYDSCGVCNGQGPIAWFRDSDNDGLGDSVHGITSCLQPNGYVSNQDDPCDDVAYGWDIIGVIFQDNGCTGCHGGAASGGLDLRTYASTVLGGIKCGSSIINSTNLVNVITITGYSGCGQYIVGDNMNLRVGGAIDNEELAMIQAWVDSGALENCDCQSGDPDSDGDGICDAQDNCPGFNNNLIGTNCNDGNPCTINDSFQQDCNCQGIPAIDTDNDGVCDALDVMPYNSCTADGTIDGIEAFPWTGSLSNDCDGDGIILAQGDIDDFSICIDNNGYVSSVECNCGSAYKISGGLYKKLFGYVAAPYNSGGMPDGITTSYIGFGDTLALNLPIMKRGDEICVTIGFAQANGLALIELNGIGTYQFENTANLINLQPQEFCFEAINDGPQTIFIMDGIGSLLVVDGTTYKYCPCTLSDPFYNSPDCQCINNQLQTPIDFEYHKNVTGDPTNAAGLPDGIFTGHIAGIADSLVLSFPQVYSHAEICVTVGFSNPEGVLLLEQSNQFYSFKNVTGQSNHEPQEYCFSAPAAVQDNWVKLSDNGPGSFQVDGGYMISCIPCGHSDTDSDNDGICDVNDPCPMSATGDSDGDGVCDDLDICPGFDDNYDSDNDGNPNGCDTCYGYNDNVDSDGDGVPNGCDLCEGYDDNFDFDNDGIPNGCDSEACSNFVSETNNELINSDKAVHIQINTNGYVENNSNFTYTAGENIVLNHGFEVIQGGTFHAFIAPCMNTINN